MFRFGIFMVLFISQIKQIVSQYQPKGNIFQVKPNTGTVPGSCGEPQTATPRWRGEIRTRKAQRNKLQNQNTKNKPRGQGKPKDKNRTSEHSCCKNYLQGG